MDTQNQLLVPVQFSIAQKGIADAITTSKALKVKIDEILEAELATNDSPLVKDPELLIATYKMITSNQVALIEADRKYIDTMVKAHKALNPGAPAPKPLSNDVTQTPGADTEENSNATSFPV